MNGEMSENLETEIFLGYHLEEMRNQKERGNGGVGQPRERLGSGLCHLEIVDARSELQKDLNEPGFDRGVLYAVLAFTFS